MTIHSYHFGIGVQPLGSRRRHPRDVFGIAFAGDSENVPRMTAFEIRAVVANSVGNDSREALAGG